MSSRVAGATREQCGYPALLNCVEQPHWTVFLSDFALPRQAERRLRCQLNAAPTQPQFITMKNGCDAVARQLRTAGVDLQRDYVSFQGFLCRYENVMRLGRLFDKVSRRDMARLEFPFPGHGFEPLQASQLLDRVMNADYAEQERISDRFFELLGTMSPYEVTIETAAGKMTVRDRRPWFDIAGRLREQEFRILPAGEVSYTGDCVDGRFAVDGAILPLPEHPEVALEALHLASLSGEAARQPLYFEIRDGNIVAVAGKGHACGMLSALMGRDSRYRKVTEVGIAFNRACGDFVHHWPAASNEVRPGVHVGIGGDPSPDERDSQRGSPLIHIDCMAANCEVIVNKKPFLRASS